MIIFTQKHNQDIIQGEEWAAMKRKKSLKAVGPDDLPVEVGGVQERGWWTL